METRNKQFRFTVNDVLAIATFALAAAGMGYYVQENVFKPYHEQSAVAVVDNALEFLCVAFIPVRPPEEIGGAEYETAAKRILASEDFDFFMRRQKMLNKFTYEQVTTNPVASFKITYHPHEPSMKLGDVAVPQERLILANSQSRVVLNSMRLVPGKETCGDAVLRYELKKAETL